MSTSRRERARCVLKLCEYAARNLDYDFEDATDPEIGKMVASFHALGSKLRYLAPRASAAWAPCFDCALGAAHSMRVTRLDEQGGGKEALRGHSGVCMACGRNESNCRYAIDLVGSDFDMADWITAPSELTKRYAEHLYGYDEAFQDAFVNPKRGVLPDMDMGRFIVGTTCLRKAQLRFMLQTLLLDAAHEADYLCGELGTTRSLWKDELYTLSDERCDEFVELQDAIEFAITDEKRPLPDLKTDRGLWANIDKARAAASGGGVDRLMRTLRLRAGETLARHHTGDPCKQKEKQDGEDEEWLSSASDDEDEEFSDDEPPKKRQQRPAKGRPSKARVACSEDEEEEEEEEGLERKRTRLQTRRAQEKSPVPAPQRTIEDVDEDDDEDEEDVAAAPVPAPAPATATPQGRREAPGPSAVGLAGRQRAAGALGSREAVLMGEMELQLRLARQGDAAGAAQCSATILTLQELIEANKQLSHSRHL